MQLLQIKESQGEKIQKGYPWIFKRDLVFIPTPPTATLVKVALKDEILGSAYYNPDTQLAARMLSFDKDEVIDSAFFVRKFKAALIHRERNCQVPFYRLIHAEGDNLPGLIIDRFDTTLVCQTTTAGMESLKPLWIEALKSLFNPQRIIFRDDSPSRLKEGLTLSITQEGLSLDEPLVLRENECWFFADPMKGQKTGWFFDQRRNREWVAKQSIRKNVLDLYTYQGGFGITAACYGAKKVTLVDSSESALKLAELATIKNQVEDKCELIQTEIFSFLESFSETFDIVIADPPAFIKSRDHQAQGLKGYQKLAKLVSKLVAPNGILFIASCSHHAGAREFREAVEKGIAASNRQARLVRKAGADFDHPIHRFIPENHYLKTLAYRFE